MQNIKDFENMVKLDLPDDARAWMSGSADMLMDSFGALAGIETDGVAPMITVLDIQNVLREDAAARVVSREELLSRAPEQYDGYFQVPKTLG